MKIKEAYDIWADQYDSNENRTRDLDKKITEEILSQFEFKTVLELGCGTGKNTEWLLRKAERIVGLDFSEKMLNKAKNKIVNTQVEFKKADLNAPWEVEDHFADLITSSLTLEHINDLEHIFNQAQLKTEQDGLFFICELHPFKQYMGSRAKFETESGTQELETYVHNISEYINNAKNNNFELIELQEWFDNDPEEILPRLISFVFKKK